VLNDLVRRAPSSQVARLATVDVNSYLLDSKLPSVTFPVALVWGKDDGAEVCIAGKEGTFVIHGFADGTVQSVTDAGAPADAAARLGKAVRFAAKPYGKTQGGWRAEWAIPFAALDLKPAPGLKIAFNIGLFRADDGVWRCVEGTLAQNWRLDQAATLQLK
jgi:hypothetical protein